MFVTIKLTVFPFMFVFYSVFFILRRVIGKEGASTKDLRKTGDIFNETFLSVSFCLYVFF